MKLDHRSRRRLPACLPIPALLALMAGSAAAQSSTPTPGATEPAPVLPAVRAKATAEPTGKETLRATTTSIGKGKQELRDVPQSITVVTEKLIDDRNLDTLKESLKNTAGISFQAAEGGEEDIRLRGFSLQASGDIFIDGMRDPAFYERDSFNWDRLEVLRGSASMLFGRGSTGGAVNQVSKLPFAMTQHEIAVTMGSGGYLRALADFNLHTGDDAALRINAMVNVADNYGAKIDKRGVAPSYRWGIGTRDEFLVGAYYLQNDNGIHYGLPWLEGGLWPTDPKNYYGMASDYNRTGTTQAYGQHVHRFDATSELKTQLRAAEYSRDQHASTVRFTCATNNGAALSAAQVAAGCTVPLTRSNFGDSTLLNRGSPANNKNQSMDTVYAQSDYTGKHKWFNLNHDVAAGVDAAHEKFTGRNLTLPTGVTLAKPRTTVGTPDDGAWIDESLRVATVAREFTAKSLGVYAQDLVKIAPMWKLLAGLRWDKFDGSYHTVLAQGAAPCTVAAGSTLNRSDSLWSKRFGVLFQPTDRQSYHLSYGTSFNTAGDAYQYDAGTSNVDPESSRNVELGAKLDSADGRFTTRLALFHSTKYNERNRDSETVNACNYVLSGKRHSAGLEMDLAGRITPAWEVYGSYAWIPSARIDEMFLVNTNTADVEGARPGLVPRHSGTIWTTYQIAPKWRVGGGLNARSGVRPVDPPPTSTAVAPKYVTADLMAEYTQGDLSFKANLTNVTDKHYAEYVYRGHYVPGKPRTLQVTAAYKF